jgi:putative transposase
VTPSAKREVVAVLVGDHGVPGRRACQAVRLSRAAYYRPPRSRLGRDLDVVGALNEVVARHARWGFWKCFYRLRRAGHWWNHKRVHRVYCTLRLNLPRRTKRRVPTRLRQPLVAPARLNETWALDFMADALYDGRGFRTFNVLDEGNREALAIEIGTSIPSAHVIRVLDDLIQLYGRPARVRVDNGTELTAEAFVDWCGAQRIAIGYIQPGKPDQNAFIERFNRTFREEVLDAYLFDSLEQVQQITDAWLATYNTERPHDSLGQVPPLTFLPRPDAPLKSTFEVST